MVMSRSQMRQQVTKGPQKRKFAKTRKRGPGGRFAKQEVKSENPSPTTVQGLHGAQFKK